MTNKDLVAYGRKLEEERLSDRAVYLLHRIRVIEDEMKMRLVILQQLRQEYDEVKLKDAERRQTSITYGDG